jgi:cation diffusion facilitator CzcD-associated flavoprotein CzcO
MSEEESNKYCIVGAGASGLAALKNLQEAGIPCDSFEREDDIGGNWYFGKPCSSVYQSTHLISSKRLTEYTDFPMPKEFPPYPNHRQVLQYFRSYAEHFQLRDRITFNTSIKNAVPTDQGWRIEFDNDRAPQTYRGLIIANGHHWDPKTPNYEGDFRGPTIHSHDYKTPDLLKGKRVLVVGAGNSGCDIAVEAAQNAEQTFLSIRRGYHFLPKFLLGSPIDARGEALLRLGLPLSVRRFTTQLLLNIAIGKPQQYGLPKPDHKLFETHPIVNSQLLYYVGHGDIQVKPDIRMLGGERVEFSDGTSEEVDLIIYATGYHVSFPFLDRSLLFDQDGHPQLFLNVFHQQRDDLFVAGLIQPDSGLWGLADYQTQLIAKFIGAIDHDARTADWFRGLKTNTHGNLGSGIKYDRSSRHLFEVEHFGYRKRLRKLIAKFD